MCWNYCCQTKTERSSNAYELSAFSGCVVARIVIVGIVVACVIAGISTALVISNEPVAVFEDKTAKVTVTPQPKWESIHSFGTDDLGNYKNWCVDTRGVWVDENYECRFEHKKDALVAYAVLEDLQSEKITGKFAEAICEILQITCPENVEFDGYVDLTTNYVHYDYADKKLDYNFKILNQQLKFKGERLIDGELFSTGPDYVKWNFQGDQIRKDLYSVTWEYESDSLGNYESWCNASNGLFYPSNEGDNSKVGCEFSSRQDAEAARDLLHELETKDISGELAQKLCRAYGKECQPGVTITMDYDMGTGDLYTLKRNADVSDNNYYTEYRIIEDDVIQYRAATSPPLPWITFEN